MKTTAEVPLAPIFGDHAGIERAKNGEGRIPVEQLPRCGGLEWSGSNRYQHSSYLFCEIELMKEQVWTLWRAASPRYCVVRGDTRGPGRDCAHTHESGRDPHCRDELSCASLARSVAVLTSDSFPSQVYPAASYATTVKKNRGTVAVLNLAPSQGDDKADFVFYGPCEETIPA